jgi:RNA polymerase sigma-70 factor (ECF subfamily)
MVVGRLWACVWSVYTVGIGKGNRHLSVSVARVEALQPATALGLDAFGPVPDVIDRARNGDRAAFAELYDSYVDNVYRYLLYRVREPSDAEDLCSEVFTRAFANIHRYRWQGKSFLAWLYTIARNAVTDRRRRERPTVEIDKAYGLAADGPTAHEQAVHGEAVDALRGAVRHLTTEQQEVLVLRFVENRSSREVAKILGKNEGAIRALQFRALGRLRKLMPDLDR